MWVNEVGAINFFGQGFAPDIQRQSRVMAYLLSTYAQVSPRIERIYVYHWRAAPGDDLFDSGLLDVQGVPAARLLPVLPGHRPPARLTPRRHAAGVVYARADVAPHHHPGRAGRSAAVRRRRLRPDRGGDDDGGRSPPGPQALAPTDTAPKAEARPDRRSGPSRASSGRRRKPVEGDVRLTGLRGGPAGRAGRQPARDPARPALRGHRHQARPRHGALRRHRPRRAPPGGPGRLLRQRAADRASSPW